MDGGRIQSLQILRFLAAAMVVTAHAPSFIQAVTGAWPVSAFFQASRFGAAGVDIFFVLSGFVIALTGPLAEPRPSGALFFWRRWRRVAPVYFVISIPMVAMAALAGDLRLDQTVSTFLFWPALGPRFVSPYLGVGWTLSFEMVFYSSMALLLAGGRLRRNLFVGAGVLAAAAILRVLTGAMSFRFLTSPLFLEFVAGVLLANRRKALAAAPAWLGWILVSAGTIAFGFEAAHGVGDLAELPQVGNFLHDATRAVVFGLPAAAIVAGAVILDRVCRGPVARALSIAGDASYSIYLTQSYSLILAAILWRAAGLPTSHAALTICAVGAGSLGGLVVYRLVEQPLLRNLKRLRLPSRPLAATD